MENTGIGFNQFRLVLHFFPPFIRVHLFRASVVPFLASRAEAGEDCHGCFFGALASFAHGADAGRAAFFARASGDQFARFASRIRARGTAARKIRCRRDRRRRDRDSARRIRSSAQPRDVLGGSCRLLPTRDPRPGDGGRSPMAVPRSRASHISSSVATDSSA